MWLSEAIEISAVLVIVLGALSMIVTPFLIRRRRLHWSQRSRLIALASYELFGVSSVLIGLHIFIRSAPISDFLTLLGVCFFLASQIVALRLRTLKQQETEAT